MITSKQNSLIKKIRSLWDKKNRDSESLFIAEGVTMVKEALNLGLEIEKVVCTEKIANLFPQVLDKEILSDDLFNYVSTEVTPQGVLALIRKPKESEKSGDYSVYLDGLQDPSNVGAIIRTAAASGYNDVYLSNCADAYSPKAVRASMSGIYKVRIHTVENADKITVPMIVADMGGENVYKFNSPKKFCLVIGNEARGVSEVIRNKAKYVVSIPMENDMESLNAGVSAGILMYTLKLKV